MLPPPSWPLTLSIPKTDQLRQAGVFMGGGIFFRLHLVQGHLVPGIGQGPGGSAAGLLKEEMTLLGSLALEAARESAVSAGGALAVDRDLFSAAVTRPSFRQWIRFILPVVRNRVLPHLGQVSSRGTSQVRRRGS